MPELGSSSVKHELNCCFLSNTRLLRLQIKVGSAAWRGCECGGAITNNYVSPKALSPKLLEKFHLLSASTQMIVNKVQQKDYSNWKYLSVHDCCNSLCPSFVLLTLMRDWMRPIHPLQNLVMKDQQQSCTLVINAWDNLTEIGLCPTVEVWPAGRTITGARSSWASVGLGP